jgi:hypothetical protein
VFKIVFTKQNVNETNLVSLEALFSWVPVGAEVFAVKFFPESKAMRKFFTCMKSCTVVRSFKITVQYYSCRILYCSNKADLMPS